MTYQYMSALSYCEIQLIRFICSYCTLIYKEYVILLFIITNNSETLLISQILNKFICDVL